MDIVALAFYALVCGALSIAAPQFGSPSKRMAVGAVVGIVAAAVLPIIRTAIGV